MNPQPVIDDLRLIEMAERLWHKIAPMPHHAGTIYRELLERFKERVAGDAAEQLPRPDVTVEGKG